MGLQPGRPGLVELSPALPDIKRDEADRDNRRENRDSQRPIDMRF